ncbi:unnamed protein product [Durusdinium trenchii]|uniref:Uncharacterized protein n=1 Tax=Durusdinium trenchii TaxID=1381693 RepID=A0ABP0JBV9_9DINO
MMNHLPGSCRWCSENPFNVLGNLLGLGPKREEKGPVGTSSVKKPARHNEREFKKRTNEEVKEAVALWSSYVHVRAKDFFQGTGQLEEVLSQLAAGTSADTEPVASENSECVHWWGDTTKDDCQAAIRMVKPGEHQESVTYVNRVLAFMFATDDCFEKLMQLPKEPFKMSCGDQLCVQLGHIALQTC